MSIIIEDNVASIFRFDTFMCSIDGKLLREYMMAKHGWSERDFNEYLHIYMASLNRTDIVMRGISKTKGRLLSLSTRRTT